MSGIHGSEKGNSLTSISLCGEEADCTMRQVRSLQLSRHKRSPASALLQWSRLRGKAGKMDRWVTIRPVENISRDCKAVGKS